MAFQFDDTVQPGAPQWQVVEREELDAAQTQPPASQEPLQAPNPPQPERAGRRGKRVVLGLLGLALLTAGCSQKGDEGKIGALPPVQSNAGQSSTANDPDTLAERCADFRVIYVLSDEERPGYEHGFVSAALLEKYIDSRDVTFFLCGPKAMYDFVLKELAPYDLPVKAIRKDATFCGDRAVKEPRIFQLTVHIRDQVYTVPARENETLLTAMERAGINAPNKCRAGGCGYCHSKWISGEYVMAEGRDGRREADRKFGFIHPCVTYPTGDMVIDVPPGE